MKNINERCPLSGECERKKCEFKFKENECSYYIGNARPGEEIDGMEVTADILDLFNSEGERREIEYIDIDLIHPHPDNPRKDVGDVSELAESIKHSGIMQNLTVVPFEGEYRVIIGHRRLAASKLAGLSEVPCVVVEMSEKEQIATMLSENMQRVDLTPLEEVQGVQMLLDLGESIKDIQEITGFSESKVRQRIKLAELPRQAFSENQGGTLEDYIKITKIEDPEVQKSLLKKMGTDNFKMEYNRALSTQKTAKNRQKWVELFESFAYNTAYSPDLKYVGIKYLDNSNPDEYQIPEDADDVKYYYEDNITYIRLYRDYSQEEQEQRKRENRERHQREVERDTQARALVRLREECKRLRYEFLKDYKGDKAHAYRLTAFLIDYYSDGCNHYFNQNNAFVEFMGITVPEGANYKCEEYLRLLMRLPQKVILSFIAAEIEGKFGNLWNWNNEYCENKLTKKYIEILKQCGYRPADEEKAFYDGTHELYYIEEREE